MTSTAIFRYNIRRFGELGDMCMLDEIKAKREEIHAIARRHKAEKLWVFGSCARSEGRIVGSASVLVGEGGSAWSRA